MKTQRNRQWLAYDNAAFAGSVASLFLVAVPPTVRLAASVSLAILINRVMFSAMIESGLVVDATTQAGLKN